MSASWTEGRGKKNVVKAKKFCKPGLRKDRSDVGGCREREIKRKYEPRAADQVQKLA